MGKSDSQCGRGDRRNRPDQPEHLLVKADQVALELFWKAPDRARQRLFPQISLRHRLEVRPGPGGSVGAAACRSCQICVFSSPGEMAFTRIRYFDPSIAAVRVSPTIACLEAT